jgi:hypothetical protein
MKSGPKADYPVRVYDEPSDRDPPEAELFEGVFTMVLNYIVYIVFVPDVSAIAPPWNNRLLGGAEGETTVEQARLTVALPTPYVVTPNEALAGTEEPFEWGHDEEFGPFRGTAFYVTPGEFDRYSAELAQLAELNAYSVHPKKTVSELLGREVIGFVRHRVLASRWVRPAHAEMLCLNPAGS